MGSVYVDIFEETCENTPLLINQRINHNIIVDNEQRVFDLAKKDANRKMHVTLKAFFMNPIEKWTLRRRFPWKMCIQLLIIFFGIIQMSLFAVQRSRNLRQNTEITKALNKMFLKDWVLESSANSNSNPLYSVYSATEFYEQINFVVNQYGILSSLNFGRYFYDTDTQQNKSMPPLSFCLKEYDGHVDPGKFVIYMQKSPQELCFVIPYQSNSELSDKEFSISDFLDQSNYTLRFETLITAKLQFRLRTVVFKSMNEILHPECYRLNITILYDNTHHDGHIPISKMVSPNRVDCEINVKDANKERNHKDQTPLNLFIIMLCLISMGLCLRSIYRSLVLSQETVRFFNFYYGKIIPFSEQIDFVDFWYITIFVGDALVVFGSILKLQIEAEDIRLSECTNCSFLLGIGYFLSFIGTLRFFRLLPNYNILLETAKRSVPTVMRYLVCVALLFLGYCFCGWMILAPYHPKFVSFSSTAENLFADMNGDGVYETFSFLETDSDSIWWFARIYLYSFFFLFLYFGASLLGSVILDAYETVKDSYFHGKTPSTTVEVFLSEEGRESISSASHFKENRTERINYCQHSSETQTDYTSLEGYESIL